MASSGEVTALLAEIRGGNRHAEDELIPLVYEELRRLASHYMRKERVDHTLQTTALVNEAYLRLVNQRERNWENRAQFFGLAAGLMRRVLVDHARGRNRNKRGGGGNKVSLDEIIVLSPRKSEELIELDRALDQFSKEFPRQCKIVELRYFDGLSFDEIASISGGIPELGEISSRTAKRYWEFAQAWLHREIFGN